MKVDQVRVIRDRPPPERSEIVPYLLIATFLVNPFPSLIAVSGRFFTQVGTPKCHSEQCGTGLLLQRNVSESHLMPKWSLRMRLSSTAASALLGTPWLLETIFSEATGVTCDDQ